MRSAFPKLLIVDRHVEAGSSMSASSLTPTLTLNTPFALHDIKWIRSSRQLKALIDAAGNR